MYTLEKKVDFKKIWNNTIVTCMKLLEWDWYWVHDGFDASCLWCGDSSVVCDAI